MYEATSLVCRVTVYGAMAEDPRSKEIQLHHFTMDTLLDVHKQ